MPSATPTAGKSLAGDCGASQRPLILRAHCSRTTVFSWRASGAVDFASLTKRQKSISRPEGVSVVGEQNPSRPSPPGCYASLDGTCTPPSLVFTWPENAGVWGGKKRVGGAPVSRGVALNDHLLSSL